MIRTSEPQNCAQYRDSAQLIGGTVRRSCPSKPPTPIFANAERAASTCRATVNHRHSRPGQSIGAHAMRYRTIVDALRAADPALRRILGAEIRMANIPACEHKRCDSTVRQEPRFVG
eukprot:scaffold1954_cov268-Pinguiococcus_pyrenoidosus.AAC.72